MNRATKKNNVYVVVSAMFLLLQTGADVVFFELLTHRIRCIHQFVYRNSRNSGRTLPNRWTRLPS